jgi:predicted nucleic acid-binding protein
MKRLKLYLETSVWNFYFADDAPEKKDATLQFFERVKQGQYDIFISEVVFTEIARASEKKMTMLLNVIGEYEPVRLALTEEVIALAQKYLDAGVLPTRAVEDARHAAIATVYEMDALISWNLSHLANLQKMEKINGMNLIEGYSKKLELVTPMEVSYD